MSEDAKRPPPLPLLPLPTHPVLESDDMLASILASDIKNDPLGACKTIDNFCRLRKCSDDFWMNVAVAIDAKEYKTSEVTWKEVVKRWCEVFSYETIDVSFVEAARLGYADILKRMDEKYENMPYLDAFHRAVLAGHLHLLDWLAQRYRSMPYSYLTNLINRQGFFCGGHSGSIAVLEWLVNLGGNDWKGALLGGARQGHIHVMEWAAAKGATDWNGALVEAAFEGQIDAMEWAAAKGATDWNEALRAVMRGSFESVALQWVVARGANDWNGALLQAARIQKWDRMKWAIDRGADDLNAARKELKRRIEVIERPNFYKDTPSDQLRKKEEMRTVRDVLKELDNEMWQQYLAHSRDDPMLAKSAAW